MSDKNNKFEEMVRSMFDSTDGALFSRTVMGDPIEVNGIVIIPLSDVTIGIAAGSNNAAKKDAGMGGISAKLSPSSVLIIKDGSARVVNVKNQDAVTKLMDMVPDVIDRFKPGSPAVSDEEIMDLAFPDDV